MLRNDSSNVSAMLRNRYDRATVRELENCWVLRRNPMPDTRSDRQIPGISQDAGDLVSEPLRH
ncbi:hypothetical protein CKA32_001522 [Geitlerinema sp. FC II]|nr:hypothetical protein CKA32_001522 [Geitlerinema sp. FC II]